MPLQHLDDDARAIVSLANEIAHEYELEYVGTEHVLLAILRHSQGVGAKVLHSFGLDEFKVRAKIDDQLKQTLEDTWVFGRLPGSPHYRNVIELAINEARQLESNRIGSEHLLLALLRERDSSAARTLAAFGVSLERCKSEVLKQLAAS